jgi:hypothetical protein
VIVLVVAISFVVKSSKLGYQVILILSLLAGEIS